jgi:hypothetical protein
MFTTTVRKEELLTVLRENRAKHRQVFEKALEGWHERASAWLEDMLGEVKAGKAPKIVFPYPVPKDHTPEYDTVLLAVEMEVGDTIELDERMFTNYVMDRWAWTREFASSSNSYAGKEYTASVYSTEYADLGDEYQ